jgi:hypothetical protein
MDSGPASLMARLGAAFVPPMRRLRWVSACVLCLALAACEQLRTQLNDVMQLGAALQTQFNVPVQVNIAGGVLSPSVPDQAADKRRPPIATRSPSAWREFTRSTHGIFRHLESETTVPTPIFASKCGLCRFSGGQQEDC